MRRVDFRKVKVEVDFNGDTHTIDVSKDLANYCKSKTTDIGFEDFCRDIYHKGEVDMDEEYIKTMTAIISDKSCPFYAFVKRGILNILNNTEV